MCRGPHTETRQVSNNEAGPGGASYLAGSGTLQQPPPAAAVAGGSSDDNSSNSRRRHAEEQQPRRRHGHHQRQQASSHGRAYAARAHRGSAKRAHARPPTVPVRRRRPSAVPSPARAHRPPHPASTHTQARGRGEASWHISSL